MGENKDYTCRFMINIGNWLYEKNVLSLDELIEFKGIVEKQKKTNNLKIKGREKVISNDTYKIMAEKYEKERGVSEI